MGPFFAAKGHKKLSFVQSLQFCGPMADSEKNALKSTQRCAAKTCKTCKAARTTHFTHTARSTHNPRTAHNATLSFEHIGLSSGVKQE